MSLFFIIAAGPSFMDVTEEEWEFLKDKHTISFARVPYSSRKTEYHFSIERDYIDKAVLTYMAKLGYLDTKLLLSIPESIRLAKELGFKDIYKIFKQTFYFMPSRMPWFVDEPIPPHKFIECRAHNFYQPIFRYRGQLSAVINAALILGASEIRLIAVDLNSQHNFYANFDYLKKVCKDEATVNEFINYQSSKYVVDRELEKKIANPEFHPDKMHTTNMPYTEKARWGDRQLRGISDVLQWMDKELREEGLNGIYITNKNSLLYKENKLQYKSIMDT